MKRFSRLRAFAKDHDQNELVRVIDCKCIDDLEEGAIDQAMRFLIDVTNNVVDANDDVTVEADQLIERITA